MGDEPVISARFGQSTTRVFIRMCSKLMPSSSRMGGSSASPSPSSVDEMLRASPDRPPSADFIIAGAMCPLGAAAMCPLGACS